MPRRRLAYDNYSRLQLIQNAVWYSAAVPPELTVSTRSPLASKRSPGSTDERVCQCPAAVPPLCAGRLFHVCLRCPQHFSFLTITPRVSRPALCSGLSRAAVDPSITF